MKKEKPILFSTPMIHSILGGTKIQTRRVVKTRRNPFLCEELWVRETWRLRSWGADFDWAMVEYRASPVSTDPLYDGPRVTKQVNPYELWGDNTESRWLSLCKEADSQGLATDENGFYIGVNPKWCPSIFMPRQASRIQLGVEEAFCDRLQSIDPEDAIAEGIEAHPIEPGVFRDYSSKDSWFRSASKEQNAIESFKSLWDSINKKRGFGWDANPDIWVVSFKFRGFS